MKEQSKQKRAVLTAISLLLLVTCAAISMWIWQDMEVERPLVPGNQPVNMPFTVGGTIAFISLLGFFYVASRINRPKRIRWAQLLVACALVGSLAVVAVGFFHYMDAGLWWFFDTEEEALFEATKLTPDGRFGRLLYHLGFILTGMFAFMLAVVGKSGEDFGMVG